ncbi:MAG: helix-turn-helix domain-containing protein [Flavobacteriales bacterium]
MNKVIVTTQTELEALIQDSIRKVFKEQPKTENNKTEFFNLKEAAAFLKLAGQTIYGFTSKRKIPFLKRGKKLYFKKSDLENWLNQGKKKSRAEIEAELEGGSNG